MKEIVFSHRQMWDLRKNNADELPKEARRRAATLYKKGACDAQIALACHCSKRAVMRWRKETGRESHFKKKG